jgi:hypothetical protein
LEDFSGRLNAIIADLHGHRRRQDVEPIAYKIDQLKPLGGPGRDKAYKEIREGKLRAVKNGRSTRILAVDFRQYMAELPPIKPALGEGSRDDRAERDGAPRKKARRRKAKG